MQLYSSRGIRNYWIVDPKNRALAAYRAAKGNQLALVGALFECGHLSSPLRPDFSLRVDSLFRKLEP